VSNIKTYLGLDNDDFGGMTPIGNTIRDAWIFGLLPEGETCTNWTENAISSLYTQVSVNWEKYQYDVNNMPEEMRTAHERIHKAAIEKALKLGWDPEKEKLPDIPDIAEKD
jgi:hypothetical protein